MRKQDFDINGIGKLYEGDIISVPEQREEFVNEADGEEGGELRQKRQVLKGKNYPKNVWGETIYYRFGPQSGKILREEFECATKAWGQDTCINFEESNNAKEGLDIITKYYDCASHVGKVGGWQKIYLGRGCETFGQIAHELGHALGLVHTVSRPDRDKYIMVKTTNLKKEYAKEFEKYNSTVKTYGLGYDHGTEMCYVYGVIIVPQLRKEYNHDIVGNLRIGAAPSAKGVNGH
ncbi:astacin [Ancylostoma duodenale]|uniref:Metalloendopeptidase n=1 Tax=Ancylostoma duodenale TaxID=51022 RepID=A0A0C2HCB9_9BILA|nr:astacin [Ancylostoma duodenale]